MMSEVSGGDTGLPQPHSVSVGDEVLVPKAKGAAHSSHLAKQVSGPAPVTRYPQTEPRINPTLYLPGKGNMYDGAP